MAEEKSRVPIAEPPPGPLNGILVVDLSRVLAGPFCTSLLYLLGAQILKVERPGTGDDSRAYGPFVNGSSAYFAGVNRGKGSIALHLDKPADQAILMDILARADVLVENFRPGTLEKYGIGHKQLLERFPRLVFTSISGFGQTGPMSRNPAYDLVVQAMGGIMSVTGYPGAEPTRVGASVGDVTAGIYGALGVLAALYDRKRTGRGGLVDIAMLDCQVSLMENLIVAFSASGKVPGPLGSRHATIAPFQAYATADGYMVIAAGNDQLFGVLADALGRPDFKTDVRFKTNSLRSEHVEALKAELERILTRRPTDHWLGLLNTAGVPASAINTVDRLVADAQVNARNMIVTVDDPRVGPIKVAGNPVKLSAYEDRVAPKPAPALDADRAEILKWLGRHD